MAGENLVEGLVREMARVRDEVIPAYVSVGAHGTAGLMRLDLDRAASALGSGEIERMIVAFRSLEGWKT